MDRRRYPLPSRPAFLRLETLVVLLLLIPGFASARVFRLWRTAAQSTRAMEAAGGKILYEAPITINEGKGHLALFSFESAAEDVVRTLRRVFLLDSLAFAGGSLGLASVSAKEENQIRLLLVHLPGESHTLVFKVEQSREEAERSARPPSRHLFQALPGYEPSEPRFFVTDESRGFTLQVASTQDPPASVLNFYRNRLPDLDWVPVLAGPSPWPTVPPSSSLLLFVRGSELSGVFSDSASGKTRITLFHKRKGTP